MGDAMHSDSSCHSTVLANHLIALRLVSGEILRGALSWTAERCEHSMYIVCNALHCEFSLRECHVGSAKI